MKTRAALFFISLSVSRAQSVEAVAEGQMASSTANLRSRITELVKQDALTLMPKPKEAALPPQPDFEAVATEPSVPEGVLELDPFTVTKKRDVVLPPVPRLTLENFFYGDGTIARKGRLSLSAGPERNGIAALKFNLKF